MSKTDVLIVGAGATGLMAARELSKAGKSVLILEGRDRIGGRIWPLQDEEFGYQAQAGAEFVHGKAPITRALIKEAGLHFVPFDGEVWNIRGGEPTRTELEMPNQQELNKVLRDLKQDMPVNDFLNTYFAGETYAPTRNEVVRMVEGYDAADPNRISTFALREEWLSTDNGGWEQGSITEGYRAVLEFLESECRKSGVEITLNTKVVKIIHDGAEGVQVVTEDGSKYTADQVIVTAALPTIAGIEYSPAIPEKLQAAQSMGFGGVIKILMKFKTRWWIHARGQDFSKLVFLLSNEKITTWWTQYPEVYPMLSGWLAGPAAEECKNMSDAQLTDMAIATLSRLFLVSAEQIKDELAHIRIVNWPADPYAKGAYSYATPETNKAVAIMNEPVNNKLFFAGEALYDGKDTAIVEGAFASGRQVAQKILAL